MLMGAGLFDLTIHGYPESLMLCSLNGVGLFLSVLLFAWLALVCLHKFLP
jgi:hypothetical protein